MDIKVGIPRALLFYEFAPLWINFFKNLDVKVVVSNKTNKDILNNGVNNSVDELCLPIKVIHGHVIDLKDRVDYIFLPRIMSVHKGEHICVKFGGVPELVKYAIKDLPKLITTEFNVFLTEDKRMNAIYEIGEYFEKDRKKIKNAYEKAYESYKRAKEYIKRGVLPLDGYADDFIYDIDLKNRIYQKKILVLGHQYNLYDTYVNMNLIKKIKDYHVDVLTPQMIDEEIIGQYAEKYEGRIYWTFSRDNIGAALYGIDTNCVDGIIYISSFVCGLDSVIADAIERRVKRKSQIPFMLLTIDEHTGEAGINTRIEAFIDMIMWKDMSKNDIAVNEYR